MGRGQIRDRSTLKRRSQLVNTTHALNLAKGPIECVCQFLYAVRVDTSDGFLLCPADECQTEDAFGPPASTSKFHIVKDFDHPILERYRRFLADNETHIAGIEFILDKDGELYTYDINTNTNYNQTAETEAGVSGMRRIAEYLGDQLAEVAVEGVDERQVNTG